MDIFSSIPHRPPFLFVDKVVSVTADMIVAERTFGEGDDFYRGHYPGNPITPGVILCECVFQAAALLLVHRAKEDGGASAGLTPVLSRIQEARFKRMVKPGDTVQIEVKYKETLSKFHFLTGRILLGGKPVMTVECSLAMIDESAP